MRRRGPRLIVVLILSAVGAVAALGITSATKGAVSVGTVEVRLRPDIHGGTELGLPPLGQVAAPTHRAPLTLSVDVTSLDVDEVQQLIAEDDPAARLRAGAVQGFEAQIRRLLVKTLVLSALVGAAVAALLPGRRWLHLPVGAVGGLLGVAAALGLVWRGYDSTAFEREPRFEGALEQAPPLLSTIQRHVADFDVVRNRVAVLGARIAELYTATAVEDPTGTGDTRVLHVSDIHSNPIGIEMIDRLVESFDIDAVIDTGDITTFGSPLEARIGDLLADVGVPYYLVAGNHDSPANRVALAALPQVVALDGDTVEFAGISVLGVADPTFTADGRVDTAEANEVKERSARGVARQVRRQRPDVLAVHDLRQAAEAAGEVPLIIAGHTHERSSEERDGTLLLTVGSAGATGLGSFTAESDLAYEAEILHFRGGRLVSLDYISLTGLDGSFVVDHTVVPAPE